MHLRHSGVASLVVVVIVALVAGACSESDQSTDAPRITLQAPHGVLVFKPVPVGSTDRRPLRIQNEGVGDLVIREFRIGEPEDEFRIVDGAEGGTLTIPANEYREVWIEYAPTSAPRYEYSLQLRHNDSTTHRSGRTDVRMRVQPPHASLIVTPNPLNFGRVVVGDRAEMTLEIVNTGDQPRLVTEYFIRDGEEVFSILPETRLARREQLMLASDARHQVRIAFDPVTDDFAQAVFVVRSDDVDSESWWDPVHSVDIYGNGVDPCVEASPASMHDYGERPVYGIHRETFAVHNCSDQDRGQPLVVTAIGFRSGSSAAFWLVGVPRMPFAILPGGSLEFDVVFAPRLDENVEVAAIDVESIGPQASLLRIGLRGVGAVAEE